MNCITIDMESWIHSNEKYRHENKKGREYIEHATFEILEILKMHGAKTTFFVVSEIFEWNPEILKDIKKSGHEIAWHTHTHKTINDVKSLEKELDDAHEFIKKFRPKGFRAPRMYLPDEKCLNLLERHGFMYDSSVYSGAVIEKKGKITEIPVSTFPYFGFSGIRFPRPLSTGLLMREWPYGSGFSIALIGKATKIFMKNKDCNVIFMHPWQIVPPEEIPARGPLMNIYFKKRRQTFEMILEKFGSNKMMEII